GPYEFPVYIGCSDTLMGGLFWSPDKFNIHGSDGMGDLGLRAERLGVSPGWAVEKICSVLRVSPAGTVEIVTLGPLTNIAAALRMDPAAVKRAKRITIMGSAGLGYGNVTATAEANIWHDPEAAAIVLDSGIPLMFVGWDACLGDTRFFEEDLERLSELGELGKFCVDINRILIDFNEKRFGVPCFDMADPAAMAAALYPECISECSPCFCRVDCSHGPSRGTLILDRRPYAGTPNAEICSGLDPGKFKEYVLRTIAR
ncbi:MAG: nucleoside hydrolase, partial [Oscillospiraceae bacterium]